MSLVVQIPVKFEDRFAIAFKDATQRYPMLSNIKLEDVEANDRNVMEFYFDFSGYMYNNFFHILQDIETIMEIPIKFRYCRSRKEAYTQVSKTNFYKHLWLEISKKQ